MWAISYGSSTIAFIATFTFIAWGKLFGKINGTTTVGAVLKSNILAQCIGNESARCSLMCRSLVTCRVFLLDECTCTLYEEGSNHLPDQLPSGGVAYIGTGLGLVDMLSQ